MPVLDDWLVLLSAADSEVILVCLLFVDGLVLLSVAKVILMCLFFVDGLVLLSVAKVIL